MFTFSFLPLQDPHIGYLFSFSYLALRCSFFANQKHCASARCSLLCGDASVFASHLPKAFFFLLPFLRSCLPRGCNCTCSRGGVTQQSPFQVHNIHVYIFLTLTYPFSFSQSFYGVSSNAHFCGYFLRIKT